MNKYRTFDIKRLIPGCKVEKITKKLRDQVCKRVGLQCRVGAGDVVNFIGQNLGEIWTNLGKIWSSKVTNAAFTLSGFDD